MKNRIHKLTDFDSCGQKKFYRSKKAAWHDAARQNRESYGNVIKRPYKCKFCSGYHLSSFDY